MGATIVDRVRAGRLVYVHCWGGHGRTGTVLCGLLVKAYGMKTKEAAAYFMATHDQRIVNRGGGPGTWPHSDAQRNAVARLEDEGTDLDERRLAALENWTLPGSHRG